MQNYKKISKFTLLALMAVGIIVSVLFFLGGAEGTLEVAGDYLNIPRFSNLFLIWNYILIGLVCLITLAVVVWEFIKTYKADKKKALRSLSIVVGFVALIIICWVSGDESEVRIIGYEGTDNVGIMAKLSDACLYLTYVLTAATLAAMVWGICYTKHVK